MEEKESTVSASPGNSEADSPAVVSNMAATQAVSAAVTTAAAAGGSGTTSYGNVDSSGKKKRGRPRKYDADGNLNLSYARVTPFPSQTTPFSLSPASPSEFSSSSSSKRGKGRPPGSGNWQLLASLGELFASTAGGDFTPHVVTVGTGEDVATKILSFVQKGPRGICVLSANGPVSNVTIRQPGSSGGILTYEGRFEILSLSGSFTIHETNTGRSPTGGLSVSLAGPDGRVIGGGIAGLLTAASPIQIVVGSFTPNGYKVHKRKYQREHILASPPPPTAPDRFTIATPISQARPNVIDPSYPTPPVLPAQTQAEPGKNTTNEKENLNGSLHFAGWNGSEARPDHGQSPDINVCVPGE